MVCADFAAAAAAAAAADAAAVAAAAVAICCWSSGEPWNGTGGTRGGGVLDPAHNEKSKNPISKA